MLPEPVDWDESQHTWQCNHVHAVIMLNKEHPEMFADLGNSGAHGIVCAGCKCHEGTAA